MPRGRPPGSKNKKTLEAEAAVAKVPFPDDDDAPLGSFLKKLNKTADKKRKAEPAQLSSPAKRPRGRPPKNPAADGTPKPRGRPPKTATNPKATPVAKPAATPTPKRGRGRPPKTPNSAAGTPKPKGTPGRPKKIATPVVIAPQSAAKDLKAAEKELDELKKKVKSLEATIVTLKGGTPAKAEPEKKKRGRPAKAKAA